MKKIIIIIALLFLTACSSINQQGSSSGTPDGIHISFLELQPRAELREGELFDIGLKLENRAECDIEGELCIRDTLTDSISGVEDDCQSFKLLKKEGGIIDSNNFYFQDNSYEIGTGSLSTNIIANAQYSCSIQLNPQVCIKPNLEDEKICKTKEILSSNTLGLKSAPLTVTSIEKQLIPQRDNLKLEVAIHLKKMTEGDIQNMNINVEYEGYGPLSCRDLDRLNFKTSTENVINCEISLNVDDVENNPLKITLSSIHETSKSKQIMLIKEEGENI